MFSKLKKLICVVVPYFPAIFIFLLPFNLVFHFDSSNAYISGRFVNYLDVVLHIVDLVVVVGLVGIFIFNNLWRNLKFLITSFAVVLLFTIHYLFFKNNLVLYSSVRTALYVLTGLAILIGGIKLEDKHRKVFINFAIVAGVIQTIMGSLQFFRGQSSGFYLLGESTVATLLGTSSTVFLGTGTYLRGYGTFPHPNVLGGFFVLILILVLGNYKLLNKKERFWVILGLIWIYAGLLLTWSRVAILLGMLIPVIFLLFKNWKAGIGIGVFGGILVSLLVSFPQIRERFINQSSFGDVSITQRIELLKSGWEVFKRHPFVGVGLGRSIIATSEYPVYSISGIKILQPVHNIYPVVAVETGILGLILFLGYLVFLVYSVKNWPVRLSFIAILLAIGLTDHYLVTLPQGMGMLFILMPLIVKSQKQPTLSSRD